MLANKIDQEENKKITTDQGNNFCLNNCILFNECSALNNINISESFINLARKISNELNVERLSNFKFFNDVDELYYKMWHEKNISSFVESFD